MKRVLTIILILSIILTMPRVLDRAQTEMDNDTYEMVVPYNHIIELNAWGISNEQIFNGEIPLEATVVAVEPTTLKDLEAQNLVQVFEKREMQFMYPDLGKELIFNEYGNGLFLKVNKDTPEDVINRIENVFNIDGTYDQKVEITTSPFISKETGETFYFLSGIGTKMINLTDNELLIRALYFDENIIEEISSYGKKIVFRISNNINESNASVIDEMVELSDQHSSVLKRLFFTGSEALGFEKEEMKPYYGDDSIKNDIIYWAYKLKDAGFSIMPIEFNDQKGFETYAHIFENQIIRLHSLNVFDGKANDVYIERAIRAVKERNIRSMYVHMHHSKVNIGLMDPEQALEKSKTVISEIQDGMQTGLTSHFTLGTAKPFEPIEKTKWLTLVSIIGGIALAGLVGLLANEKFAILAMAGMTVLGFAHLLLGINIFLKGFALIVAILAATYATLSAENIKTTKQIPLQFVKSIAIALTGAWFVTTLLFGNEYLVKVEEFKGVKLLYLTPILLVALHLVRDNVKSILTSVVRNIHILGYLIGGGAILYLSMRSGNVSTEAVSGIEMLIREKLEDFLQVRPRTKEFLIGYPLFILAMYLIARGKSYGKYFLIGGVIGFLSLVNTFTHLHIPLYLSGIRSVLGMIIGAGLGVILIWLFNKGEKIWPSIEKRL